MTQPLNLWGTNITVRVSSAAPDADPVWVDFTSHVIIPAGTSITTWLGRLTELARFDPGNCSLQLLNVDDEVTPGSVTSPYYPWFKQARRAQVVETILGAEYVLADFYLQQPESVAVQQPVDAGGDTYVTLMVSGLDITGRFRNSRKFRSALVEHIIYHGGTDLDGLWPLTQAAAPFDGMGPVTTAVSVSHSTSGTIAPTALEEPQAGSTPTAAESGGLRCTLITDAGTGSVAYQRVSTPATFLPAVAAGEAWSNVFWYALGTGGSASFQQIAGWDFSGSASTSITLERDPSTGLLTLTCSGSMAGSIASGIMGSDALLPIGVRWYPAGASLELWLGSVQQTTSLTGSAPSNIALSGATYGYQIPFDLSHIQFYSGTWSYTNFLAQINQAYAPLDKQLTGARIATILSYAGFPASRQHLDGGCSVMRPVTMTGKTVDSLTSEAVDTEQGRYFARAGDIWFHDRRTILNI